MNDFRDKYPNLFSKCFDISCPPGWYSLLDEFCATTLLLDQNAKIRQIKPKFGGLRLDVNSTSLKVLDLINEFEKKSYTICSNCGKKGKLKEVNNWYIILCEEQECNSNFKRF